MPIFEYVCQKCGDRFEKLQKANAGKECSCPACGSVEVKRGLSPFASNKGTENKCHPGG